MAYGAKEGEYIPKDANPANGQTTAQGIKRGATIEGSLPATKPQPVTVQPVGTNLATAQQPDNFTRVGGATKGSMFSNSTELANTGARLNNSASNEAFANEAKARAAQYQARTAAGAPPPKTPPADFVNDTTKGGIGGGIKNMLKSAITDPTSLYQAADAYNEQQLKTVLAKPDRSLMDNVELGIRSIPYLGAGRIQSALANTVTSKEQMPVTTNSAVGAEQSQAPGIIKPGTVATPAPMPSQEMGPSKNLMFDSFVNPNNIGMSQGAKGNVRYAQGPDGQVMREDINTGQVAPVANRITQNVLKPGEKPFVMTRENTGAPGGSAGIGFDQITKAMDRGDISAAEGQAVYQNANMSPAQRQQKALMQTAFTQPDGQTPIGSIGGMKRNAATAADLLSKQMAVDSNAAEYGARRESALAKMVQDQMQFDQTQKNADKALQLKQTGTNLEKAKRRQEMFAGRNEDPLYLDFLKREGGDNPDPSVINLADRAYQDYLDQTLSQM